MLIVIFIGLSYIDSIQMVVNLIELKGHTNQLLCFHFFSLFSVITFRIFSALKSLLTETKIMIKSQKYSLTFTFNDEGQDDDVLP